MKRTVVLVAFLVAWAGQTQAATKVYSSGNLHLAIPDGGVVEHSISVQDRAPIHDVAVAVRLDHPRDSDLTLTLVSPSGTEVVLVQRRGGGGANFGGGARSCRGEPTVFSDGGIVLADDEPPFVNELYAPEEPLARLRGEEARGRWKLRVADDVTGKSGTLFCWWLTISRDVWEYRRASLSRVRAVLSFKEDDGFYREARLQITRRGAVRFDAPVRRLHGYGTRVVRLLARDLDGDGDPEVILDVYTGGAHCCAQSLVYHYERSLHRYRRTFHDWGNAYPPYRIVDPDHDGRPELRSVDDRFAYVFTAFAGSFFPMRMWRFDHGRMLDVTRQFPTLVSANAGSLWKAYLTFRHEHIDVRGALAAWLADEYLLGRGEVGWRTLVLACRRGEFGPRKDLAGWPQGRAYLKALRSYLRALGYAEK